MQKLICKRCKKAFKIMDHLKGTILDQKKVCYHCGHENAEIPAKHQKPAFKDALKVQLSNMSNATEKVLKDAFDPVEKIDADMKKALGDLY